ncbi:hypothetical protein POF50_012260 [Streptomyces sp. SL13]|jgi:hypothetical protein|uniref:Uncharacterized protein n=1 Tax=Streptantibioticus silvisoli TaxID=2705255 RepID=A0AA90H8Y2_9ACTN|nr:hypothetical protein [Streptantibioticus silvisoli]MDI5966889.1 hypothetical protein [Streptantibioticus silvisoli]MDI5970102.1 hypothetical protein [Streptantibioticus silvisoli]
MADVNAFLATAAAHPALVHLADVDDNKVTPGLLGFVVFAALGAAVWLLMKSMNKQFKKVNFEVEPDEPKATAAAGARRDADEPSGPAGE